MSVSHKNWSHNHRMLVRQKPHSCRSCHKIFADENRLENHLNRAHGSEESKTIQCKVCEKRFLTSAALGSHVRTHRGQESLWECSICKKTYDTREGLTEHIASHAISGTYACPSCQKVFSGYLNIRKHIMKVHRNPRIQCNLCDCSSSSKETFENHMLRHSHQQKQFTCEHCKKMFKRGDKLREHIQRLHSGASSEGGLMVHRQRTKKTKETNDESTKIIERKLQDLNAKYVFKCGPCLLGFKRRGMLVNHVAKVHPETRPNEIPELNLPIMMTFRDFYCHLCEKVYKSNAKRKAHIMKFHPGVPKVEQLKRSPSFDQLAGIVATKPEHCPWCYKQYATNAKLLQHVRNQHSDKSQAGICKRGKKRISGSGATTNSELEGQISQKMIVTSENDGFYFEGCSIDSSGFELSRGEGNHGEAYCPANASTVAEAGLEMHDAFMEDIAVCISTYNRDMPCMNKTCEDKCALKTLYSLSQMIDDETSVEQCVSSTEIPVSVGGNHNCCNDWLIDIQVRSMSSFESMTQEDLITEEEGNYKIEGLLSEIPMVLEDENNIQSKPIQLPPFQVIYSPYPPH